MCRFETLEAVALHHSRETFTDAMGQSTVDVNASWMKDVTHEVAVTSTYCPGTKCPAFNSVPTLMTASAVTLNSCTLRLGDTPAARKWPTS